MKAVHNALMSPDKYRSLVIAHVKLQNESSSQRYRLSSIDERSCDCSRKITK